MQKENRKDTSFYRQLYILVLPIAIQNLISAMVNSVDVLMLNYVSESAIAAVSLANQVMFVLFMFITGLTSGIAMLVAQYWGKQDVKSIEKIFGISLRFSFPITALFAFATAFFPQYIMRFFTPEAHLIELGASYLKVLSVSYLFIGFSQMYLCTVRSIERVKFSTITSSFAILLNIILNAGFIWGLFGLPQLGILGVGIATTIARGVELIICIIDIARKKSIHFHPRLICEKNTLLYKDFITYSLPALGNECVWGLAFTMYSVIMGHMGEALVAANSVVTVARNIFSVVGFGIAYGGAIILEENRQKTMYLHDEGESQWKVSLKNY